MTILIDAYKLLILDSSYDSDWEEDDFTASLVDEYMIKIPLKYEKQWFVAPQRPYYTEKHLTGKTSAKKAPRPDIRFEKYILSNPKPFTYTIEAKILKSNSSTLKRRYISTGIDNFKSERYPKGCLAGYVLNCKSIDCVFGINKLLRMDGRNSELLISSNIVDNYKNTYISTHNQTTKAIELNHIFLEF